MTKELGNEHLKAGRLAEAIECYAAALAATGLSGDDAAAIHANRALAHLKRSEYALAVSDCDAALAVQPRYVKALFRRAQAREGLADLTAAFRDVQTLLQIDPANRESQALAKRLRVAMQARAASADLSAPRAAVEALAAASSPDDRARCAGHLSRLARDASNAHALLHAGAVPRLLALLPSGDLLTASEVATTVVGLAVEALERIAASDVLPKGGDAPPSSKAVSSLARKAIWSACPGAPLPRDPLHGSVAARLIRIAGACARGMLPAAGGGGAGASGQEGDSGRGGGDGLAGAQGGAAGESGAGEGSGLTPAQQKLCEATAGRCLSLLSLLGSCRAAVGSQDAQAAVMCELLLFTRMEGGVQGRSGDATGGGDTPAPPSAPPPSPLRRFALDALLRMSDLDAPACRTSLPDLLCALMWRLGDDESEEHRTAMAIIAQLMAPLSARVAEGTGPAGEVDKGEEESFTKSCCAACEAAFSPILRGASPSWDETVAAVHGVSAVLETNKAVGAWLLRQESIFWSLAEVADMEDEGMQRALAEIYAHAAGDQAHFKGKEGEEPIKHLKVRGG
jgi:hypothetical protein